MALFESIPNISEGRRMEIVDRCVEAMERCGARIIHRTSDPTHNRSVLTAIGSYEELRDASLALAIETTKLIDLQTHRGVHPRIGALDVLPFVPLKNASMQGAVDLAKETGELIWKTLCVPSFLYGEAASMPQRRNLANVRNGQFEGLNRRFERPDWTPDFGLPSAHRTAGAIAIGARDLLVAFNVDLDSGDLTLARKIARAVRESDGGLRTLKALGFRLGENAVQVSLNITDYRATPLYRVFELVCEHAARHGVEVLRSELIGCLPREAVTTSATYYLGLREQPEGAID